MQYVFALHLCDDSATTSAHTQVSIQHDCSSSSLTLGVMQAKLHPRPSPADQPEPEILVNVYLIPVPTSTEAHRSTKLVQASPNGDAVWRQTFQPYDLQLRQVSYSTTLTVYVQSLLKIKYILT